MKQKILRPYQNAFDLPPEHQEVYFRGAEDLSKRINEDPEDFVRLELIRHYCAFSWRNVLGIGGMLSIPEISGYKRLRKKSSDLDFVVNDEGLEALLSNERTTIDRDSLPGSSAEWYVAEKNGISVVFLHNEIRGYELPEKAFTESVYTETIAGPVFTISVELNSMLKVRRATYQNHDVHGKDALDVASTIVGMQLSGREFNHEAFADYLIDGTREHCSPGELVKRIEKLGRAAANNLPRKHRELLLGPLERTADYIREKADYYEQDRTNQEQTYQNQS